MCVSLLSFPRMAMSVWTGKRRWLNTTRVVFHKSGIRGWRFHRASTRICAEIQTGGRTTTTLITLGRGASIATIMEMSTRRAVASLSVVPGRMLQQIRKSENRSRWLQRSRDSLRLNQDPCSGRIKVWFVPSIRVTAGHSVRTSLLLHIGSDLLCNARSLP